MNPHDRHVREIAKRLREAGYSVRTNIYISENGRVVEADVVAKRHGECMVIEVKTSPATRNGKRERKQMERLIDAFPGHYVFLAWPENEGYVLMEYQSGRKTYI